MLTVYKHDNTYTHNILQNNTNTPKSCAHTNTNTTSLAQCQGDTVGYGISLTTQVCCLNVHVRGFIGMCLFFLGCFYECEQVVVVVVVVVVVT